MNCNTRSQPQKDQSQKPRDLMHSLAAILKFHNTIRASDAKRASDATAHKRRQILFAGFCKLRELGFRMKDAASFGGRHMQALVDAWVKEGLSPSSIQNRISVFRVFAGWIGKAGMVEASVRYVADPAKVTRSGVARTDKSWEASGVDVVAILAKVKELDERVAMALELQLIFGLRVRESLMLQPHIADLGQLLDISRGAKNGRRRMVRIETNDQRQLLGRAKALVGTKDESIAGPVQGRRLHQARNHYYTIVRKAGISRKNGIVSHGLRHQNANAYFADKAGYESPVQGGPAPADKHVERYARVETAEHLGHSRPSITAHYVGSHRAVRRNVTASGEPHSMRQHTSAAAHIAPE